MMVHSYSFVTFRVFEMIFELMPHFLLSLVQSLYSLHLIHTLVPLLVHQQAWLHIWMHCSSVDLAVDLVAIASSSRVSTIATHTHHLVIRLKRSLWMIPSSTSRSRRCVALRKLSASSPLIISIYIWSIRHIRVLIVLIEIVLGIWSLSSCSHLVGYHCILPILECGFLLFINYHHRVSRFFK